MPLLGPGRELHIASPCPVSWQDMAGDERTRFCSHCRQHVFDLSGFTREEAEALIREKQGQLCVRYFLREDGTIMTADCPAGAGGKSRPRRHRGLVALALFLALVFSLFGWLRILADAGQDGPVRSLLEWLQPKQPQPPPAPPPPRIVVMGKIACPPPAQVPKDDPVPN